MRPTPRSEDAVLDATPPEPLPPHPLLTRYYRDEVQRRRQVTIWFDESAARYDWISQALSFGFGTRYRQEALVRTGLSTGMSVLDVACGTGILAVLAQDIVGDGGRVVGLDPSDGMLRQAASLGVRTLVSGMAEALPFGDERFDLLSMGYALRHVADLRRTFREYHRVLKPGGRLLILEITPPRSHLLFRMLRIYLRRIVPLMARVGGGGRSAQFLMEYHWDTIEHCVMPPIILMALEEAGFTNAERHVDLGIFSVYTALRPQRPGRDAAPRT